MDFTKLVVFTALASNVLLYHVSGQCPSENELINQFNSATLQQKVYGIGGEICVIEEEDNDHDHEDDDNNKNHEDEDHHDFDDVEDHDYDTVNTTSCDAIYKLCRSVIIDLGLTTEECLEDHGHENETYSGAVSEAKAYGYGFLMVIFVSVCSLGGVFLVPLINNSSETGLRIYDLIYAFMVAIAISALISDAVLHLIPHAFGLHAHEEGDGHSHEKGDEENTNFIWKGCLVLLGIYGFYLLEFFLHTCGHSHGHGKETESNKQHSESSHYRCSSDDVHYTSSIPKPNASYSSSKEEGKRQDQESNKQQSESSRYRCSSDDVHYTSSIPRPNASYSEEEKEQDQDTEKIVKGGKKLKIKPVAWLIIIGDCVHNFADGIALGAAISQSLSLGLSTMFALVFHELPHEFGDFVILVKSGFHWRVALLINFLQSLTAVVGLLIGVAISTKSDSASNWILSLTAGLFFYIALTDLLPDLIHGGGHNQMKTTRVGLQRWDGIIRFSLINLGFLLAFAILLILAIYEENLNNLF